MSNFTEFNSQAVDYARYRPLYPEEIFQFLSKLTPAHDVAYDIGTGNGQCAVTLSKFFKKIWASDLSREQIANAIPKENISYFVSQSHESHLSDATVDLITIATALHWFDFDKFYPECKRILKPDGVIAAWSYGWHECENAEVTKLINTVGKEILKDYWSPQPKLIWNEYKTIPFPFEEIHAPRFTQTLSWNLEELVGYLTTWSATQKYINDRKSHPVEIVYSELLDVWGDSKTKFQFTCPLYMRVGRNR